MSNLVVWDPALAGSLGTYSIFEVEAGRALPYTLYIPDTHYVLVWNTDDRAWYVRDACGWYPRELNRLSRRVLGLYPSVQDYHLLGKILQGGFGEN